MNSILKIGEIPRLLGCALLFSGLALAQETTSAHLFDEAVRAQQNGDLALAIRDYRQLLKLHPDFAGARANLGAALAHLGQFNEAIAEYRAALKTDPKNTDVRMNLALAYFKTNDFARAADEFSALHKANPQSERIAVLLGECDLRLQRNKEAVALLTPLKQAHSDDLDLCYVLGSALIDFGDLRSGLPLIERVAKTGNSADAWLLAGRAELKLNEFTKAETDLESAVRLNPNLPGAYTLLGAARDSAGDREGAEQAFRQALQRDPKDFQANLHLGAILFKERNLDSAKPFLEQALAADPSSVLARYEMALLKSATGHLEEAANDLEKVTQDDPHWLQPHIELATIYYRLHRAAEGMKQREIVDRLSAEQQQKQGEANKSSLDSQ